jgi:hypothetical protein
MIFAALIATTPFPLFSPGAPIWAFIWNAKDRIANTKTIDFDIFYPQNY